MTKVKVTWIAEFESGPNKYTKTFNLELDDDLALQDAIKDHGSKFFENEGIPLKLVKVERVKEKSIEDLLEDSIF